MNSKDLLTIKKIVNKYIDPNIYSVFVFGSQATGNTTRSSDLDIAIEGPNLDSTIYFNILSEFEESDLPYTTDLVELNKVSKSFKKKAKSKTIPVNYKL